MRGSKQALLMSIIRKQGGPVTGGGLWNLPEVRESWPTKDGVIHCLAALAKGKDLRREGLRGYYTYSINDFSLPPPITTTAPLPPLPTIPQLSPEPTKDLGRSLDELLRLVGQRIVSTVMEAVREEIEAQLGRLTSELVEQQLPKERPNLPKILILGLLPGQEKMMQREFGDCFNLSFQKKGDGGSSLRAKAQGAAHVLAMTDFISHSMAHTISSHPNYHRVPGGMTALRDALTNLYVGVEP